MTSNFKACMFFVDQKSPKLCILWCLHCLSSEIGHWILNKKASKLLKVVFVVQEVVFPNLFYFLQILAFCFPGNDRRNICQVIPK